MIKTIIMKELQGHLKSAKFLIGMIVTAALLMVSTSINIREFIKREQDYLDSQRLQMQSEQMRRIDYLFRPPQPLSILVQGKDKILGSKIRLDEMEIAIFPSGYSGEFKETRKSFATGFENVDLIFVVKIALSLIIIFLVFDTVAGEKTQGTLKAILANAVPKSTLLIGKMLGGMVVIFGSFIISSLLAFLLIGLDPSLSLSGNDWVRILGIVAYSLIYLCFFYSLSLFASVASNRPAGALLILLQVWILLIVIYPSVGFRLSEMYHPIPNEEQIERIKATSTDLLNKEFKRLTTANFESMGKTDMDTMIANQRKAIEIANKIYKNNKEVNEMISRSMTVQMRTAQYVGILSPAVLYDLGVERLAKTGIPEYEQFMRDVAHFHEIYFKWFYRYLNGNESRTKDSPQFLISSESLVSSLKGTILSGAILLIETLVFFALAYVSFLKKDIR